MLEGSLLRPGDVVLSTQRAAPSLFIRLFTWSRFSHAAIVLGDGTYAEAVSLGVRIRSIRTVVATYLMVRRLKQWDAAAALRAAEVARGFAHARYWLPGAALMTFRSARKEARNRLFCSQLVARAYEEAGTPIVTKRGSSKVTPGRLARSALLETVNDAVFVPKYLPDYLVSAHFETLSDRETRVVQSVYADLVPWFEEHGRAVPWDLPRMQVELANLPSHELRRSLDAAMRSSMVTHGYFELAPQALEECVKPLEKMLEGVAATGMPTEHARNEYYYFQEGYESMSKQAEIQRDNEAVYREEFARTSIPTFDMLALNMRTHAAISEKVRDLSLQMMHALHAKYGVAA